VSAFFLEGFFVALGGAVGGEKATIFY